MKYALRAGKITTLSREKAALGIDALNAPLVCERDQVILVEEGVIRSIEPFRKYTRRSPKEPVPLFDLGEKTVAPGLINAHCHLELSYLAGKGLGGKGFVPWLGNLIGLLQVPSSPDVLKTSIEDASGQLASSHTVHVGDITSRYPGIVANVLAQTPPSSLMTDPATGPNCPTPGGIGVTHLLEVLGFPLQAGKGFPPAGRPTAGQAYPPSLDIGPYTPEAARLVTPQMEDSCAIAGHALYSTSPQALQTAHGWCVQAGKPFSMHLAEFEEETHMLESGRGALFDLLDWKVLPPGWKAPAMRPVAYAQSLGLLGEHTMAVHCVQCDSKDISLLARTRTACCLCPRSNQFIDVGVAPAREMARQGILLCLGTDGLSSNVDLDMGKELRTAGQTWNLSPPALLRMATVNAAHALRLHNRLGTIEAGKEARFSLLEDILP